MITVLSTLSSTSNYLTTLTRLKTSLGLSTDDDSEDSRLTSLIARNSSIIEGYLGRKIVRHTLIEKTHSVGSYDLLLERYPVTSVSSVSYDGSTISSTEYYVEDSEAGILARKDSPFDATVINKATIESYPTRYARRDWSVTYTAGYDNRSSNWEVPGDLEQACIDMIKGEYYAASPDPNVTRVRVGDAEEYRSQGSGISSPTIIQILDRYRS